MLQKNNYSYWESKQWFRPFDLIVIGSGIIGLNAAISFKLSNKKARVLVLDRGVVSTGASMKNAGFACFGSVSELDDDLTRMSPEVVWSTVAMRWEGLRLLRQRLGDKAIDYKPTGGYELFTDAAELDRFTTLSQLFNVEMRSRLGLRDCYSTVAGQRFGFQGVKGMIYNQYEGQIDTSRMMTNLTKLAWQSGIEILGGVNIDAIQDTGQLAELNTAYGIFRARKTIVAINGFAASLLKLPDVRPARAQVLITSPIPGLKIKGTFHYQQGYYYFRNIDGRLLFGGGRNLDPEGETTDQNGLNPKIQNELDTLLKHMLLPSTPFSIEQRWSGIMGVGNEKKPIIEAVSPNVIAAVRMGGMGVAIGTLVGQKAARLAQGL